MNENKKGAETAHNLNQENIRLSQGVVSEDKKKTDRTNTPKKDISGLLNFVRKVYDLKGIKADG